MKLSTSILSASNRINAIYKLNHTESDYLHIDVMDGRFVPNKQMPIDEILQYAKISDKKLDIHLMVEDPENYINQFNSKNIEFITFHYEINKDLDRIIEIIKNKGYKAAMAIKPNTPVEKIEKYLNKLDMILIMSVEPGLGGQKFIDEVLDKAIKINDYNKDIIIEMDGGINDKNIDKIKKYVDIIVCGSYITNKDNYNEAINKLKN